MNNPFEAQEIYDIVPAPNGQGFIQVPRSITEQVIEEEEQQGYPPSMTMYNPPMSIYSQPMSNPPMNFSSNPVPIGTVMIPMAMEYPQDEYMGLQPTMSNPYGFKSF